MRHRTVIERNTEASDQSGGFTDSWTSVVADVPCRAWSVNVQEIVASDRPELINTRLVLMPAGTDVRTGDRLTSVTDRQGKVLFSGPLIVDGISEKPNYVQLTTRKIT